MAQAILQLAITQVISFFARSYQEHGTRIGVKAAQRRWAARRSIDQNYTGSVEPRRLLLGYFRAGGLDVMPALVSGEAGTRLHRCIALSDGPIEAVDAVNYNNDRIEAANFGGGGTIGVDKYAGVTAISPHLGTTGQAADSLAQLAPGWSPYHRGEGVAYVYLYFQHNVNIFKGVAPQVTIEGRGALCYDPRLDTSPGANPTNLAYWEFSTNPALTLVRYLLWDAGGAESPSNIDWDDVVTAANVCDEDVDIPGSTTQKRYTCSVEVYAPQSLQERDDTIKMLQRAMLGICYYSRGKWKMRAGAYTTPAGSITDDDFVGDSYAIDTDRPSSSGGTFNTVRGTYVDQFEQTQPKAIPEVSASSYVIEDGEVIYTDLSFPTVRTVYEAERNAIQLLRLSRRRVTIAATLKFRCWKYELWDIVNVTCSKWGFSGQPMRITAMKLRQNFTVEVELTEVSSTDYDDPDVGDYEDPEEVGVPVSDEYTPGAPRNFRATGLASAIQFEWDAPENAPVGVIYTLYEYTSSTPFSSATELVIDTAQTSIIVPRSHTNLRYFWIRAKDPATGRMSTNAPPSNGLPAAATSASGSLGALVSPGSASASVFTANATTNSVTVTPTGGTGPYTYAWSWLSGGTDIDIDSVSSATTTFSDSTSLSEGETRSGIAECLVTDNLGATATVQVAVTITRNYSINIITETVQANGSASGLHGGGTPAVASWFIMPAGSVVKSSGGNYQWIDPSADASDYEVRFTIVSGSFQTGSGPFATWNPMNTGYGFVGVRTPGQGVGTSTQQVTVEIRAIANPGTIIDTASITLSETLT